MLNPSLWNKYTTVIDKETNTQQLLINAFFFTVGKILRYHKILKISVGFYMNLKDQRVIHAYEKLGGLIQILENVFLFKLEVYYNTHHWRFNQGQYIFLIWCIVVRFDLMHLFCRVHPYVLNQNWFLSFWYCMYSETLSKFDFSPLCSAQTIMT